MNNWMDLKVSGLYCLNKDLIACHFSLEKDQLVQIILMVGSSRVVGGQDDTSPLTPPCSPPLTPAASLGIVSLSCVCFAICGPKASARLLTSRHVSLATPSTNPPSALGEVK